jgi:hypothetical protein
MFISLPLLEQPAHPLKAETHLFANSLALLTQFTPACEEYRRVVTHTVPSIVVSALLSAFLPKAHPSMKQSPAFHLRVLR